MKNNFIKFAIALTFFIGLFSGCQKDNFNELNNQDLSSKIKVKKNILIFKSWAQVDSTIDYLSNKDDEFIDQWEQNLGFVSLRKTFNQFIDAESIMGNKLDNDFKNNEKNITKYIFLKRHNSVVKKFSKSITLMSMKNGSKYYDMNINLNYDYLAPLVNNIGIIVVDSTIYRFTMKDVRIIAANDWSKLPELSYDNSPNIKYLKSDNFFKIFNHESISNKLKNIPHNDNPDDCDHNTYSNATSNNWGSNGVYSMEKINEKYLTILYYTFWQHRISYNDNNCNYHAYYKTNFKYKIRTLKRGFFGFYYNAVCNISYRLEYSGNNINNYTGIDFSRTHTIEHTILNKTTYSSNIPSIDYTYIWLEINPGSFHSTYYLKLIVNHGKPIPIPFPGSFN